MNKEQKVEDSTFRQHISNEMLGDVFSILEKEPPTNKPLLVCSYFDTNNNLVRYSIARYTSGMFISEGSEVLNVGFWAELKDCETIDSQTYHAFVIGRIKKNIDLWLSRYFEWEEDFYCSTDYQDMDEKDVGNKKLYISKFIEQYEF